MSDKPPTFEEAYAEIVKAAPTTVLNKPSYEWIWNKSRAVFFVEVERSRAAAVAAAYLDAARCVEILFGDAPVQASLKAQAVETGRIAAREKALREKLEALIENWLEHRAAVPEGKLGVMAARAITLEECADQLRAALEEMK